MSAYVIIVYTDEPHETPMVNVFPTDEAAEAFYVEDAADEWHHDGGQCTPREPRTADEAAEVYRIIGSTRKVHLLAEGHTSVCEHDAGQMLPLGGE